MNRGQLQLTLQTQRLAHNAQGWAVWQVEMTRKSVDAALTAILICDMWDNHWCRGAAERVNAMVPRMNQVVQSARNQGVHIIHAPSDTLDFYAASPARQRIQSLLPVPPPAPRKYDEPPLPIDDSDHGADTGEVETFRAWSRQHAGLEIVEDRDVIADDGREIYSYLRHKEIDQVLLMGVHTNMCILNRTFGIKQMVRWGVNIALVRDLTDAMYNPASPPYVSHDEGTQLVIGYIEKFWCPTILSADIIA